MYSAANSTGIFSVASFSLFILSASIGLTGLNKEIWNFFIPSSPSLAITSDTLPKSLETLYASSICFLYSFFPVNPIASASITVFSAIPKRKVPNKIFNTNFASNGVASFSRLEMYFIFKSWEPLPSKFAILNKVS